MSTDRYADDPADPAATGDAPTGDEHGDGELYLAEGLDDLPELRNPVLIAAFEGWGDAGEAASRAIEHLELLWDSTPLATLDPEGYYDFQVNRPVVKIRSGVTRELEWPTTRVQLAAPAGLDRDVLLLHGIEPNFRWRAFTEQLLDLVFATGVTEVIMLGAMLGDAAHTRPVPVSGAAHDKATAKQYHLDGHDYEGPSGIASALQHELVQVGIRAITFWATVPHYVGGTPSPKATIALLERVEDVLDFEIPLGALPDQARRWEQTITEMAEQDADFRAYVEELEAREDDDATEAIAKIDGDAIAEEFERYLRRRGGTS